MEIIEINLNDVQKLDCMAACIGYFDGMHIGHAQLIKETLKQANKNNLKSACITFHPDPWCVLKNLHNIPHISSMDERIEIGREYGLDYWIILPFTTELSKMSTSDFEKLLFNMNIQTLICGFDYSYGYKGQGKIDTLKKQSYFDVIVVDEVTYNNEKISSTRIEKEIMNGNMSEVNCLLGRLYSIQGWVVDGRKLGKTIGFPTANIKCKYHSILPKAGVYIGYINIDDIQYKCMINIGHNPTFNYQNNISIEVNIIDFDQNIYGKEIQLFFNQRLRDEKKFQSKEELIAQLKIDALKAKNQ